MVEHYDRCLKRSYERLEKKKTLLAKSSKRVKELLISARESLDSNSALRTEIELLRIERDTEKSTKESLKTLLKVEKKRLRESRLLEVGNERRRVEERVQTRMEAKLGKLKSHCGEMEIVNEKRSLLGQATCLRDFYEELEESGVNVSPTKRDMVVDDIKVFTDELNAMEVVEITDVDFQLTPEVVEITDVDFQLTPEADRMPVEEWAPASPVSEDEIVSSPSFVRVEDEADPTTGELLAPLFGPSVIPPP